MIRILACKTIEREVLGVRELLGCGWPVDWLEAGLHNWPGRLREAVQGKLDGYRDVDTVALAMSLCGNAVVGLETGDFSLVIPRCDDCVTLLLGSTARRRSLGGTYFLTQGWLESDLSLWAEYDKARKKYGPARAKRIFSTMLAHYRSLALVDTGCFDADALSPQVREMAAELGLESVRLTGTLDYLKALMTPPWEENRFLIVPPHTRITGEMCRLEEEMP